MAFEFLRAWWCQRSSKLKILKKKQSKGEKGRVLPQRRSKHHCLCSLEGTLSSGQKNVARFLRLTGQTKSSDMIKADLVVTGCKTDWLRELLEDLLSESNTFVEFLSKIEETFPVFESDMHIRQQLSDPSKFKEFPKLDEINQMEARTRKLVARLTCGYSEYDKLVLLRSKRPAKTWSECKDTPARKALTHSYSNLLRLLKALSMERESDQAADRHAHLNYAQYNAEAELFTGEGKGEGKGGGKGKGKGRGRGGSKGEGGRGWQWAQEHPPPAFKVTIYCEYCGKRNHAVSNCWKKQKDEKKQQEDWNAQQQAPHQGQPVNPKPAAKPFGKPAPKPAPSPKGAPNPAPVAAPEEEGSNKKKRKLLSMEKYLSKQCEKHGIPLKTLQAAQK